MKDVMWLKAKAFLGFFALNKMTFLLTRSYRILLRKMNNRVSFDMDWVGFDLIVPPSAKFCLAEEN